MAPKFMIETFGCQMNDLDSEKIADNLRRNGMEAVEHPSEADLIILNTCSVREKAVQKVYSRLGEIKRYKARRPSLLVGVVGCMAQLERDAILKRAPFVDVLAGPQKGHLMGELVRRRILSCAPVIELRSEENPDSLEIGYFVRSSSWSAGVTISEGCNRQCAFCVVPYTRGKERNREGGKIIEEIKHLAAMGYCEVILLGQTVNSYRDPTNRDLNFAGLLKRISEIEGIKRIRFMSPHPADFSDELLEVMVSCPSICDHIHLPVQSGSNKILQAMHRGYAREQYLAIIEKIRKADRAISISTDVIVGYPGETEKDFEDTLSLMDEVKYDSAFCFKYSPRPHTAALKLADDVPEEEKQRRLEVLEQRQKLIQYNNNAGYLGRTVEVLVEGKARSRVLLTGRTTNNKIVNFDGPESLIGQFVPVRITAFSPNSLKGSWTG